MTDGLVAVAWLGGVGDQRAQDHTGRWYCITVYLILVLFVLLYCLYYLCFMACLYHLYYLYYSKSSGGSHQEAVIEAPGLRIPQRGSHQEGTGHIGLTRVVNNKN